MADYIYYDEPALQNQEILAKSDAMMQGNKWRLFRLEFYYAYYIGFLIYSIASAILLFKSKAVSEYLYAQKNG